MSDLQAAPTAAANPPAQARAGRLEKFQRERRPSGRGLGMSPGPAWRRRRPGNPAQSLENTQSAPGFAPALEDAFSSGTAAAHANLRDALIAAREGAAAGRPAPVGGERPGNPPQGLDNAQFAPGKFGWAPAGVRRPNRKRL